MELYLRFKGVRISVGRNFRGGMRLEMQSYVDGVLVETAEDWPSPKTALKSAVRFLQTAIRTMPVYRRLADSLRWLMQRGIISKRRRRVLIAQVLST